MKCRRLFCLLLVLPLLTACSWLPQEEEELAPPLVTQREVTYSTIQPEIGSIQNVLSGTAELQSERVENLQYGSDQSGRLLSLDVGLGQKVSQGDVICSLETDALESDLYEMEIANQIARNDYQQAQEAYAAGEIDAYDLRRLELELELSDYRLAQQQKKLEESRLYAPFDGYITYRADLKKGDPVTSEQTIAVIADMADMQLCYTGTGWDQLHVGDQVTLKTSPGPVTATVVASGQDAPSGASDTSGVWMQADGALPSSLLPGSTVSFEFVLEQAENVLLIPKRLIQTQGGNTFVYVLEDGVKKERGVQVGIEDGTRAEIVSGLTIDDRLIDQ